MPMNAKELADHIARQIEEAAQMGEPPSFAFENRWDADSLLAILRAVDGSSEAEGEMIHQDAIYREFLSRAYKQDWAAEFIEAAKRRSATEGP